MGAASGQRNPPRAKETNPVACVCLGWRRNAIANRETNAVAISGLVGRHFWRYAQHVVPDDDLLRAAAQRLRTACELHEAGVALVRARFMRSHPTESASQTEQRVVAWLRAAPLPLHEFARVRHVAE